MLKYIGIVYLIVFLLNCNTPLSTTCSKGELTLILYITEIIENEKIKNKEDKLYELMVLTYKTIEEGDCKRFNDNPKLPEL